MSSNISCKMQKLGLKAWMLCKRLRPEHWQQTSLVLLNFYSAFLQKRDKRTRVYMTEKKIPYMGNVEINIINTNVNTIQDEVQHQRCAERQVEAGQQVAAEECWSVTQNWAFMHKTFRDHVSRFSSRIQMVQVTLGWIILGRRKEGEDLQRSAHVSSQEDQQHNLNHPKVDKNVINSKECTHSSGFLVDFHVKPETETRWDVSRSQPKLDLMETRWWKLKELPASWKTTKTSWKPMRGDGKMVPWYLRGAPRSELPALDRESGAQRHTGRSDTAEPESISAKKTTWRHAAWRLDDQQAARQKQADSRTTRGTFASSRMAGEASPLTLSVLLMTQLMVYSHNHHRPA